MKNLILVFIVLHVLPTQAVECQPLLSRQIFFDDHFDRTDSVVRIAFFDADKTLRESKKDPDGFVDSADDIAIMPGVVAALRRLNQEGYLVAVVSNQGGVPKKRTLVEVDDVLRVTVEKLRAEGAIVNYYDFAENYDQYRKPNTGMAQRLIKNLRLHFGRPFQMDMTRSFMVGDAAYAPSDIRPDGQPGSDLSNSDRLFAENLKIGFYEAAPYFALALREGSRGR